MNKVDNGALVANGTKRGKYWAIVEEDFKATHPDCIYCGPGSGKKVGIQIHHIHPYHICIGVGRPDLEYDWRNLTSLCETESGKLAPDHHISEGHLGSFQLSNESVVEDAPRFLGQSRQQIEATQYWKDKKAHGGLPFSSWTEQEKADYKAMLDRILPIDPVVIQKYFSGKK